LANGDSVLSIAQEHGLANRDVTRVIYSAFLAPDIVSGSAQAAGEGLGYEVADCDVTAAPGLHRGADLPGHRRLLARQCETRQGQHCLPRVTAARRRSTT
jgi:hypothetical protein